MLDAGTRVLLEGGQTFAGGFYLDDTQAGDPAAPVVIGSFGEGRATLDAGTGDGIFVYNTAGVTICDLAVVGDGYDVDTPGTGSNGTGIFFLADRGGESEHHGITVTDVEVSGFINGVLVGGQNRSGFADVLLRRVAMHDNADAGFQTDGDSTLTSTDYAHHDVVVRSMESFRNRGLPGKGNSSGNGIIFGDLDGGLIEHSRAYENGDLNDHPGGGPIGIRANDADDVTIQVNVAHHNASGTVDGGDFDIDGGVTNSVMQYNDSHDNAGAGYLVFQYEGAHFFNNVHVSGGSQIRGCPPGRRLGTRCTSSRPR